MKVPLPVTNTVFSFPQLKKYKTMRCIIFQESLKYKIIHNEKYDSF